jgi:hypothetical protein
MPRTVYRTKPTAKSLATVKPVRGPGRPKGSRSTPSLEQVVHEALEGRTDKPELRPDLAPHHPGFVWSLKTPEERQVAIERLHAGRDKSRGTPRSRSPQGYTKKSYAKALEAEHPFIDKVLKKMAAEGTLPDDPMAREALEETLVVLRTSENHKDKLAAARLLLDFTKPKPTSKTEVTLRTAEDFLDEITE